MDQNKSSRANKTLTSPMKYKGGRFSKQRYQQRDNKFIPDTEQDLYEVDVEAMQRAKWNQNYTKFNIDQLLLERVSLFYYQEVYNNDENQQYNWIPLYHYDDTSYDNYNLQELSRKLPLSARALCKQNDELSYQKCTIIQFDSQKERFKVQFQNNLQRYLKRIFICFDIEDPRNYADRVLFFNKQVADAHKRRRLADSMIRFSFYIENMPIQEKLYPDLNQIERIKILCQNKKWNLIDSISLISEVKKGYAQTLNFITFEKFMQDGNLDMLPHNLNLPVKVVKEINYNGFCQLDAKKGAKEIQYLGNNQFFFQEPLEYSQTFKELCQKSLFTKNESVKALQEILGFCEEAIKSTFFSTSIDHSCRLEEFKNMQDLNIQQNILNIKINWPNQIFNTIKSYFGNIQSGAFSISEKIEEFEVSKVKKFLMMLKVIMQDTLLYLTENSYKQFVTYIKHKVPKETIVNGADSVKNIYYDGSQINREPIFVVDILKSLQTNEFIYSSNPQYYATVMMQVFDKAANDIQKFQNLECKIINEMVKNSDRLEKYLKVPIIPKKDPEIEVNDNLSKKIQNQENSWLWKLREELKDCINQGILPLQEYLKTFDIYKDILAINPIDFAESMNNPEKPKEVGEIQSEIRKVQEKTLEITSKFPESILVSCFQIQCKDLQHMLLDKYKQINKNLKDVISRRVVKSNDAVYSQIIIIQQKLRENPKDIEELTALKEYMLSVPQELEKIQEEINKCAQIYDVLEDFQYSLTSEEINKRWVVFKGPKDINDSISSRMDVLNRDAKSQLTNMKLQQEEFKDNIDNVEKIINGFHQYKNINMHEDVAKMARNINDQLKMYQEQSKLFNSRELLFEIPEITDYSILGQLAKQFQPYSNLWLITSNWFKNLDSWLNNQWEDLDAPSAEKFVEDSVRTLGQTARYFKEKDLPQILKIADQVKLQLDEFRPKVPLMVALRKQGMQDRHWESISEKLGKTIKPGPQFIFQNVLDMGLMQHIQFCMDIGEKAAKEYQIETMLATMKTIWADINFELTPFKITNVIKNYDEINQILDEHIVNTQTMQFSPYKKPFENEIIEWYNQIKLVSDILEVWAKTQGQYMYLQPIFDSADIMKQLPGETKKFKAVDQNWKSSIQVAKIVQNVLKVCQTESLLERLTESCQSLEVVQKELNNYLEKKREKFARFYFLSNDDLLEILSQTKEPTAVQPHLKKVFENIHEVEFDASKKIIAMYSAEKEKIDFVKFVNPVGKNVEDWMTELENMMKITIRHVLLHSVEDYVKTPRKEWVKRHPGQCVLNGSQVLWTLEVEESMKEGVKGVKAYWESKLETQLKELVVLVRTKLSKQVKVALNALIVIDVHAKDVVENLWKNDISELNSFEWISQLRYYWENDNCSVKCVQTVFPYGCEYLGNTMRLVITPLTDKCYMTLMGALKLNLGGAPAGPAGTGKTESTKDLAKAVAIQCVVFNCSDQMDYQMVGKFFKGLAAAGAWCCFDEFNRINIEVLSVIAQQLLILFGGKAEGLDRIENFEGSDIRLQETFCVFITMNPGYAGRSELPDNLKALFRPMAMMVPDYGMIGEIMFYSFGFDDGRNLARKMVSTFNLSSKQLSSQDHYDYGMRAVRSVINAAGLLKGADPDMNEDQLLLRALRDVNVPKFLKDDIPLFENIICDIFPGLERPKVNYGNLIDAIQKSCMKFNYQSTPVFVQKVLELYDTILVRHGLMLVGPTGGGKSCNWKVLQAAISLLAATETNSIYTKVITHILNPKSIRMGQLYGEFNEQTREWTDGILAYMVREACKDLSGEKHWILFDGPVDAIWIESMNTVLDDNKKLCLNSGQILSLTPYMTMMFEVEDLAVASPATVSRCGMVYMEPGALGTKPLIDSWINTVPKSFIARKTFMPTIKTLFDNYIDSMLEFMRKNCKELVTTIDNNMVQSLMRIIDSFFEPYIETEGNKIQPEQLDQLEGNLEPIFIYAIVWSIGCTTDYDGRKRISDFLKDLLAKNKSKFVFPEMVYDYQFNQETKKFYQWSEDIKTFEIPNGSMYYEIMVPTPDSQRNIFLMKLLLTHGFHVLTVGPTGTGKSQNAFDMLGSKMGEVYQYISITFSAQTSANQTQDTIDSKTDKRRRGIYGPPLQKKMVIFVDDLNMPKKEEYGAQPPLEILRQFLDYKGWYNRKELTLRQFEDMVMFCAMGPPGGGKSIITSRMVRHFNLLAYTELDDGSIKSIFNSLMKYFFKNFGDGIKEIIPLLIDQVLVVYEKVRNELLPTPSKSHYTFNLRDISKVFQGICLATPKVIVEQADLVRLWYHENMRVFHDRLVDDIDRNYFKELLRKQFDFFKLKEEDVLNSERILYGDFFDGKDVEPRVYRQFVEKTVLISKLYEFQEEYNIENAKKGMQLILFLDACEHISRITRILRQPMGNALLLGVGGSGRQSLSRLSCFIANQKVFQIEVTKSYNMKSWREDLKVLLMSAGVENRPIAFLFVDTQIINESMLEDVNNILNSGDITNLYQDKELEEITSACKSDCMSKGLPPNKMNIFSIYLGRVKKNIHIVICMSPIGGAFTTRLRMFPSLVNCCTIDWFCEWPEEALLGVGQGQIQEEAIAQGIEEELPQLCEMFKRIHKTVEKTTVQFKEQMRRVTHVTPKSFLEQLSLYKQILREKKLELKTSVSRLKNGLDKLEQANIEVANMQVMLTEKQPKLVIASEETEKMLAIITIDKKEADEKQIVVSQEEAEATKQTQEAQKIAEHCESSVSKANADLEEIIKKVNQLNDAHIGEIRSMNSPSAACKLICGGMVIMMLDAIKAKGGKIITKADPDNPYGKKQTDYFGTAKQYLLNEPKQLLIDLKTYKKESMNPALIVMLEKEIMPNPDFTQQRANDCSLAISFIFMWINAMYTFFKVFTETQPLRDELNRVTIIVAEKTKELAIKKELLDTINKKLAKLEFDLNNSLAYKKQLNDDIQECIVKLERAQKLVGGLSEEQTRWGVEIGKMEKEGLSITANCLIAAGMISYAGPFTSIYRQRLELSWLQSLQELQLIHTPNCTMRDFMGVPVVIQGWNICGLPKDDTSTENGIIIEKSRRFTLMIDPQNQANKFIKNWGKDRPEGIEVIKNSDPNIMRVIEKAIQFGQWVLLENVQQELDASLEPVLQQDVKKSGSSCTISLGDKTLNYDERFKIFLTTTISNPSYSPETSVKVTIINFAITPQGLEEQMLAQIVAIENPQLEFKKSEIVKRNAADRKELLKIEDSILKSLSEITDINDMLKDETMIDQLANSKKFASEINIRVAESKITEKEIDIAREGFRPVAFRASLLFFCILDLSNIDPMYQYSLQWYIKLFQNGVQNSPTSNEHEQRLLNLNNYFTYSLYENVCRSLFEKHKLLFSFLLCNKILASSGQMKENEWRYILVGPSGDLGMEPNPTTWIAETSWTDIYLNFAGLCSLPGFGEIKNHFMQNTDEYKCIYDSINAHEELLPEPWNTDLDSFQKLLVLKCLRPDKIIPGVQNFIAAKLGKEYILSPPFDLSKCYRDSAIETPLIFVLSSGSDPVADFKRFAEEQGMSKRFQSISLGQGQGPKAEKMIREEQQKGGWVLLQNCHLAISWAPVLEKLVEELSDQLHRDFRLWLTSMPDPRFPISVLQNSVKMTLEPPKGLRANLLRSYQNLDDKELNNCKNPDAYKKLLFGFCLFHAIIQDRRKFGAIGWNVPYDFTNEDLTVCKRQLKTLLDDYSEIPYKVINQLGSEINYGGRVTNDKDVLLIKRILQTYIRPEALQDKFSFSTSGVYYSPPAEDQLSYIKYIEGLPLNPSPEAFGLHDNAEITNSQNETRELLETILSVQPREASGGGKSREELIEEIVIFIQGKTPPVYDCDEIFKQYPTTYDESMNTVLIQECIRYNGVLAIMKSSLILLKKALKGTIVMSEDLENISNALYSNQVPKYWDEKSFLSLKPLASWIEDLNARINFINSWIQNGTPEYYWFSGFFFPQAFVTGVMQNYARKYTIAIDQVGFDFLFLDQLDYRDIKKKPEDGCYMWGLFFEGARWDEQAHILGDSKPKELFSDCPTMQLVPIIMSQKKTPDTLIYYCPLYKIVSRRGTLSTTGHCTNFVMFIEVPSDKEEALWIKAGVAMFLALRY